MKVSLMFWDDFIHELNNDPGLMFLYYENVLKYRHSYTPDEHYFRLVRMAFDRPALYTDVRYENSADDLDQALRDTGTAIATGSLIDRKGDTIDQAPIPKKSFPKDLRAAQKKLAKARNLITEGRSHKTVVQYDGWMYVRDTRLAGDIDMLRQEAVALVNGVLTANGIETLPT